MSLSTTSSSISKSVNAIEVYKGQSKDWRITITKTGTIPATGKTGEIPVDLTSATVYFSVKRATNQVDPRPLIYKTSANITEITVETPPTSGLVTIHAVPGDTRNLDSGTYLFDVWVLLSTGAQYPVIEVSEFRIKEPITLI